MTENPKDAFQAFILLLKKPGSNMTKIHSDENTGFWESEDRVDSFLN